MDEEAFEIEFLEGSCPMQGWGTVDGRRWQFRARYESWDFAIFDEGLPDPWDTDIPEYGMYLSQKWGESELDAGYMPREEAIRIVRACIAAYRQTRLWGSLKPTK